MIIIERFYRSGRPVWLLIKTDFNRAKEILNGFLKSNGESFKMAKKTKPKPKEE